MENRSRFRHLKISRNIRSEPRNRSSGRGPPLPRRNNTNHGQDLKNQINNIKRERLIRNYPPEINPELIFIIEELNNEHNIKDGDFLNANLRPLFRTKNGKYVLFASDGEANEFQERLDQYQTWNVEERRRENQRNPDYAQLYSRIETVRSIQKKDRIGASLLDEYQKDDLPPMFNIHINFWWLGNQRMEKFWGEMYDFMDQRDGEIIDDFKDYRVANMIIRTNKEVLDELLSIDQVYKINLIIDSDSDHTNHYEFSIEDFSEYEVNLPNEDSPYVCIIDTGLSIEHPLLKNIVIEQKKFGLAEDVPNVDEDGHGTENGGIIAYGEIEECIRNKKFKADCFLLSAKISRNWLNTNFSNLTKYIIEAIEYYNSKYRCDIFYLSFLDNYPLDDSIHPKDHLLSIVLDEIIHRLNICVICPSGNSSFFSEIDEYMQTRANRYPQEILTDNNRILIGASGLSVLTIGSIAGYHNMGILDTQLYRRPATYFIPARENDLSPFTRVGPGFNDSIKPEIFAIGGNQAFDSRNNRIRSNDSLSVVTLNYDFIGKNLLQRTTGTCIAAAKVANFLAKIKKEYKGYTGNLYRSLIVNRTADHNFSNRFRENINEEIEQNLYKYAGYGRLNYIENILYGSTSSITLFNEDEINYDDVHYYPLRCPESFFQGSDLRKIRITLSYNPPIHPTRQDYSSVEMKFYCIRTTEGLTDVQRRFGEHLDDAINSYSDFHNADISISKRKTSTLQSANYTIHRFTEQYQNAEFYIVVVCKPKSWYNPVNENSQNYAIVVSLEHENNNNLYDSISLRIRQRNLNI